MGGCLLFPKKMEYRSTLTSAISGAEFQSSEGIYRLREDGTVSYQEEGLRIDVRPLSDEDLNRRFPEDSSQGKYSTNPYTYGDWVDPDKGYIPKRFTVFEVSIYNYTHAKVELDPIEVVLLTDRQETAPLLRHLPAFLSPRQEPRALLPQSPRPERQRILPLRFPHGGAAQHLLRAGRN